MDSNKTVVLTKVEVANGQDFSSQFLAKCVSPLLVTSDSTLHHLIHRCQQAHHNLSDTNVFENVKINLVEDDSVPPQQLSVSQFHKSPPLPLKALIQLQPMALKSFTVNSTFYDDGNALDLKFHNSNCFGNAESLTAQCKFDRRFGNLALFDYQTPITPTTRLVLNSSFFNNLFPSHTSLSFNTLVGLQNSSHVQFQNTVFKTCLLTAFAVNRRTITNVSDSASDIIKTHSGDSLKTSFLLSGALDSRSFLSPESLYPVRGHHFKIDNEISGSNQFIKSIVTNESYINLFKNRFILRMNSKIGGIVAEDKVHLQDRFFQGGLDSLQGFKRNSTGPKDLDDYIGGNIFYNLKISALTPLPYLTNRPLRMVSFLNFGNILANTNTLFNERSSNLGVGLEYHNGSNASLQLNYNFPLSSLVSDVSKPGLEFALSLSGGV